MRGNPIRQKVLKGGTSWGTMAFEFLVPALPQVAKAAGAEFLLLDMEHSGATFETIKTQVQASRGIGIAPFVRVPRLSYTYIARALDVGALGVMVPMVDDAEQARFLVDAAHYPPQGRRGAAFTVTAHDDYEGGPVVEKMRRAHERTLVIAQIETAKGLENVEAIAAVPGIDVLFVGHFDLTNFMGIPAQFDHPRFHKAIERIVRACDARGKVPGFLATDEEWARTYKAKGFRMIAYGLDTLLYQEGLRRGLAVLDAAPGPRKKAKRK